MQRQNVIWIFICTCFCLCSMVSYGQNRSVNNLQDYRVQASNIDTTQILKLIGQGKKIAKTSPYKASLMYTQALNDSRQAGYNDGVAYSSLLLGNYYAYKSSYDTSILFLKQAIAYVTPQSTKKNIVDNAFSTLGNNYFFKSDYPQAAYYYYQLLYDLQQKKTSEQGNISMLYNNLGCIWSTLGESKPALDYLNKAAAIASYYKDTAVLSRAYCHLGTVYAKPLNDSIKAKQYYEKALALAYNANVKEIQQLSLLNLGNLYMRRQPKVALQYIQAAMAMPGTSARTATSLHYTYGIAAGNAKDYATAEKELLQCLEDAKKLGLKEYAAKAHYVLSLVYEESKQPAKAYASLKSYMAMNDSTKSDERDRIVHELDAKYSISEKDKQLALQQLQLTQQQYNIQTKNTWIIAIALSSLLLGVLLVLVYRNNKHKQKLQAITLRDIQKNVELNQLKAQITGEEKERTRIAREIHDGIVSQLLTTKLTLSLMRNRPTGIIYPSDLDDAVDQLDETAKEARRMAHNLIPDILLQDGLITTVAQYCGKIEKNGGLKVYFQAHGLIPRMEASTELSLYRIVQELMQNTLKHANASEILVQFAYRNDLLSITFEDNGNGFVQDEGTVKTGIGLSSVLTRVKSLNGRIDISSDLGAGTNIYMEFEIKA